MSCAYSKLLIVVAGASTFSINQINNQYNKIMLEKTMVIKGMSCGHCSARVEKVLNAIDGVEATVDLESNSATIKLSADVSNEVLKKAVDAIGYTVVEVI